MAEILNVVEYKDEGFAIIEDTSGKYVFTKDSSSTIDIPVVSEVMVLQKWFSTKPPCALLQNRSTMTA
jgi:hypothetical protein